MLEPWKQWLESALCNPDVSQRLGQKEIGQLTVLGKGSYGIVFRLENKEQLPFPVAIKHIEVYAGPEALSEKTIPGEIQVESGFDPWRYQSQYAETTVMEQIAQRIVYPQIPYSQNFVLQFHRFHAKLTDQQFAWLKHDLNQDDVERDKKQHRLSIGLEYVDSVFSVQQCADGNVWELILSGGLVTPLMWLDMLSQTFEGCRVLLDHCIIPWDFDVHNTLYTITAKGGFLYQLADFGLSEIVNPSWTDFEVVSLSNIVRKYSRKTLRKERTLARRSMKTRQETERILVHQFFNGMIGSDDRDEADNIEMRKKIKGGLFPPLLRWFESQIDEPQDLASILVGIRTMQKTNSEHRT